MTDQDTFAKGSAPASHHAQVNSFGFYKDIAYLVPKGPNAVMYDWGADIGRDALAFHVLAGGNAIMLAIEPDLARKKKADEIYPGRLHFLAQDDNTLVTDRPNYLVDALPDLPMLTARYPDLKASFALCNAVLMFIKPEERKPSIAAMIDRLEPGSPLVIRFRTVDLKAGMYPISEEEIDGISAAFANVASVEKTAPVADPPTKDFPQGRFAPDGKPYLWHQRIIRRLI